jgi:hypothetical protein
VVADHDHAAIQNVVNPLFNYLQRFGYHQANRICHLVIQQGEEQCGVQVLQEELVEMKEQRVAYEEEAEKKRKELQRSLVSNFMQKRAARCIQRHWVAYQVAKKKAAKEAAKAKGKGKKK